MKTCLSFAALLFALTSHVAVFAADAPAPAAETPPAPEADAERAAARAAAQKLIDGLKYQTGDIVLDNGLAKITLAPGFQYLDPANAEVVLHDLWGNPPGKSLGMIVPQGFHPLSDDDQSWAVILAYSADGYVQDDDAASINYDDLLKQMKADTRAENAARVKAGYEPLELIGWAAPPRYDAATHKLYWAKEIKFGDAPENTLNYNIRILGRGGVLVLNVVAGMPQLQTVEAATPALLGMVNFQEGHRYADFNPETDKVAAYGLAALVAGGVAAKTGLLKTIWLALLAGKKFAIIAVIALVAGLAKLFKKLTGKAA